MKKVMAVERVAGLAIAPALTMVMDTERGMAMAMAMDTAMARAVEVAMDMASAMVPAMVPIPVTVELKETL